MAEKDAPTAPKKTSPKKAAVKKAPVKKAASKAVEHVTVEDMHRLLEVLEHGLTSRDKSVDHLQQQIAQDQVQIEQNKKILAKRGLVYKLGFVLLAIGVLAVGFDQHTIVKSFDKDMTIVAKDMNVMMAEMTEMRKAMVAMSVDIHSMSLDFNQVSKDVSSINKSVVTMSKDVKIMSYGVTGMSYDTYDMNRSMDTMTPPWSPFR